MTITDVLDSKIFIVPDYYFTIYKFLNKDIVIKIYRNTEYTEIQNWGLYNLIIDDMGKGISICDKKFLEKNV